MTQRTGADSHFVLVDRQGVPGSPDYQESSFSGDMYPLSAVFWCLHGLFFFAAGFLAADFLVGRFWSVTPVAFTHKCADTCRHVQVGPQVPSNKTAIQFLELLF
jgi:hypothetical protein